MYTLRKRCLPTFHSTSTTSKPSDRATRSAASRIFSNCKQRLPGLGRSDAQRVGHVRVCKQTPKPDRQTQKSGLAPTRSCDPLRAKSKYRPRLWQKQGKGKPEKPDGSGERGTGRQTARASSGKNERRPGRTRRLFRSAGRKVTAWEWSRVASQPASEQSPRAWQRWTPWPDTPGHTA